MRTRTRRRLVLAVVGLAAVVATPPKLASAGSPSPACDAGIAALRAGSSNSPDLSVFMAAVEAAGLTDMLHSDEPVTIFAPNDAAFDKFPTNVLNAILADRDLLTSILTYHVVPESLSSAALAEAGTATTLNGAELRFALDGQALTINGYEATVVCADVATATATVHVIDSLLLPRINDLIEGAPSSGPSTAPTTSTTTSTTTTTTAPPTSPPTTSPPTEPPTTPTTAVGSTSATGGSTTPTTGVSPTSDPGGSATSTIAGSTTSLSPAGGALPGTGSSSTARNVAQGAALLLGLGAVLLVVTLRRRHA